MRADEAIRHLSSYKPDDELVIVWWDKEWLDQSGVSEERKLTEDEWDEVANKFDNEEFVISMMADKIEELAQEIMEDN